jgi:NAD-dependent SIR2 family protein deacetylase
MGAAFAEERISKRVTCSKCGQQFVVNRAYQASDPNWQPICPDCDPNRYYMNRSMFDDPREASAELMALAMKNWEES